MTDGPHTPKATRGLVPVQQADDAATQPTPGSVLSDRWHARNAYPVVEVEWLDAISTGDDWVGDQDLETDPAPSLAVGYLITETETAITIVALVNGEWWANGITIPTGCIVQIRRLAAPR